MIDAYRSLGNSQATTVLKRHPSCTVQNNQPKVKSADSFLSFDTSLELIKLFVVVIVFAPRMAASATARLDAVSSRPTPCHCCR